MLRLNTLQFETDVACNGGCTFCMFGTTIKRGAMPLHRIADLTFNLCHKAPYVNPFGMQEPLLETRLPQILSNVKCSNPKAMVNLYSNMSVYPEKTWRNILNWSLLDFLYVSFYGGAPKLHNELQPGAPYKTVEQNIKRLMKLRHKLGWERPHVLLEYLITPETLPNAKKAMMKWRPVVDRFVFIRYDSWRGLLPYDEKWEREVWGEPAPRVPCKELYANMYVHSNGDVVPCCLDHNGEYAVGNLFEDGWNVWWTSPRMVELRKTHELNRYEESGLCRDCTKWRYNHSMEWVKLWDHSEGLIKKWEKWENQSAVYAAKP